MNEKKIELSISSIDRFVEEKQEVVDNNGKIVEKTTRTPILKTEKCQSVIYIEDEDKDIVTKLRERRVGECFDIVNRGKLWYDKLTLEQIESLKLWYKAWLDVTETLVEPTKPEWLK